METALIIMVRMNKVTSIAPLLSEHQNFSPESLGGGTVRMVMMADGPDSAFDRAVAAGAGVVWPVDNRHGWRLGRIVDPFGHHWEIGKQIDKADAGLQ
jgi:PhnB protein